MYKLKKNKKFYIFLSGEKRDMDNALILDTNTMRMHTSTRENSISTTPTFKLSTDRQTDRQCQVNFGRPFEEVWFAYQTLVHQQRLKKYWSVGEFVSSSRNQPTSDGAGQVQTNRPTVPILCRFVIIIKADVFS